jgi:hypothetical protein
VMEKVDTYNNKSAILFWLCQQNNNIRKGKLYTYLEFKLNYYLLLLNNKFVLSAKIKLKKTRKSQVSQTLICI